jgi:hypothetical protein
MSCRVLEKTKSSQERYQRKVVSGAEPLEVFTRVVDDELAHDPIRVETTKHSRG